MYRDNLEATFARAEQLQRELDQAQSQSEQDKQRIAALTAQLAAMRQALAQSPRPQPAFQSFMYASRGTTVLVLGILSIVLCSLMGPIAWSMGTEELRRIDMGQAPPLGRSSATAGRICGIIASALLMLVGGLFVIGMLVAMGHHHH